MALYDILKILYIYPTLLENECLLDHLGFLGAIAFSFRYQKISVESGRFLRPLGLYPKRQEH